MQSRRRSRKKATRRRPARKRRPNMATEPVISTLDIRGMTCASCVRRVERALGRVEGVESANVNLATDTAHVVATPTVRMDALIGAVRQAGYDATESANRLESRNQHARGTLRLVV